MSSCVPLSSPLSPYVEEMLDAVESGYSKKNVTDDYDGPSWNLLTQSDDGSQRTKVGVHVGSKICEDVIKESKEGGVIDANKTSKDGVDLDGSKLSKDDVVAAAIQENIE